MQDSLHDSSYAWGLHFVKHDPLSHFPKDHQTCHGGVFVDSWCLLSLVPPRISLAPISPFLQGNMPAPWSDVLPYEKRTYGSSSVAECDNCSQLSSSTILLPTPSEVRISGSQPIRTKQLSGHELHQPPRLLPVSLFGFPRPGRHLRLSFFFELFTKPFVHLLPVRMIAIESVFDNLLTFVIDRQPALRPFHLLIC